MRQAGLFGLWDHLKRLSVHGDPLEELGRIVDFEAFRPTLTTALAYGDGSTCGRPPYDPVAMFKVLVLAAQNNVRDVRMEYLIRDRLSWLRFLGFDLGAPTPDANTIRLFREKLTEAGEFKLEAVKLVRERGVSVAQAARDLDLGENVFRKWVREHEAHPGSAFPGHGVMKPEQPSRSTQTSSWPR